MSPIYKMEDEQTFQKLWEFRRGNTDFYSSHDDSKSSSRSGIFSKRHKMVSSLVSRESPGANSQIKFGSVKKMHIQRSNEYCIADNDLERDSHINISRKKSKSSTFDPAALDDIKIYMESLLEDLRVTEDNLIAWMREEMQKLVADGTTTRYKRRGGSNKEKSIQMQQNNFGENPLVQLENKYEKNLRLQHQNNLEKQVIEQKKQMSEDNIQSQHRSSLDDNIQVENRQNNIMATIQVQHQKICKENIPVQHQNYFEESIQIQCQNIFEQDIHKQNLNNIKSDMKRKNPLEGS